GEDRGSPIPASIEGDDLAARGERGLLGDQHLGGEAAFADQRTPACGEGAGRGRGLDLPEGANRQTAWVEVPVAVDLDRDPTQLRGHRTVGGDDVGVEREA